MAGKAPEMTAQERPRTRDRGRAAIHQSPDWVSREPVAASCFLARPPLCEFLDSDTLFSGRSEILKGSKR